MSMIRPQPARRMTRRSTSRGGGASGGGFTLIEVLIAIGIFAIGLIAVASIFPVAILLQKQTVQEIEATHFGENARAIVAAKGFVSGSWSLIANDGNGVVEKMEELTGDDPMDDWSLADRSYNTLESTDERRVFWTPLCFDSDPSSDNAWQVFVFVVRSERDMSYGTPGSNAAIANSLDPAYVPRVKRMNVTINGLNRFDFTNDPRVLRPGERIVDAAGTIYTIHEADDSGVEVDGAIPDDLDNNGTPDSTIDIWYAAPASPGESSTFVKLITLIDSEGADVGEGDGDIIRSTP